MVDALKKKQQQRKTGVDWEEIKWVQTGGGRWVTEERGESMKNKSSANDANANRATPLWLH